MNYALITSYAIYLYALILHMRFSSFGALILQQMYISFPMVYGLHLRLKVDLLPHNGTS